MKVVFVTSESTIDHSSTMISELKKHIDMYVILLAKEYTEEIRDFCTVHDALFFRRKRFSNPLSFFNEIKLLIHIKKQKASCVWFNTFTFWQALLVKWFILQPKIVNVHDVEFHPAERNFHGRLAQKITFMFYKKSVAVMSKSQAELFRKRYKTEPYILQLPVIDYYGRTNKEPVETANDKKEIVKFFFFGSILPYKGIETLLDAVKILEKRINNFVVNIYGRIQYNKTVIMEGIKHSKGIRIEDRYINYKEVSSIFEENDIIIIPYHQVTQCGPLLIAYNQDKPLICNDLPGFREYVEEGKSGLFFDGTPQGLANCMEQVIENKEIIAKMSQYISSVIKSKFSMASLAQSYVQCFRDAAAKRMI